MRDWSVAGTGNRILLLAQRIVNSTRGKVGEGNLEPPSIINDSVRKSEFLDMVENLFLFFARGDDPRGG